MLRDGNLLLISQNRIVVERIIVEISLLVLVIDQDMDLFIYNLVSCPAAYELENSINIQLNLYK